MSEKTTADKISLTQETLERLMNVRDNPGLIINVHYDKLFTITEGKIDSPIVNSPYDYLMEAAATTAATLHQAHEATYRKQYPKLATQYEDLYNHMFDEHYLGRFAMPGRAKFAISYKLAEILRELVDAGQGTRKLIFPRNGMIYVNDFVFTFLYPIVIKQLAHGGIQVLYDTESRDPVEGLESNIIDWDYTSLNGDTYLRIMPTLYQVAISTHLSPLTQNVGFTNDYLVKNKFVHCRVYQIMADGSTEELNTTHSDLVYDAEKVTARLTYLGNKLRVHIPPIYFNKGLSGTELKVEIYTTYGDVEEPINEVGADSFRWEWNKLSNVHEDTTFVAPIENLSQPIIFAMTTLQGGRDGESFEQTRDRVINFANYATTPITTAQLKTRLQVQGYDIIKSKDNITSRSYYATRALPLSKWDSFTSGAAAAMETLKISIDELVKHPSVKNNGQRVTITPEVLFKNVGGLPALVFPESIPSPVSLGIDGYVGEINKLEYMFTPFYYVLDTTKREFNMRAYYFDEPKVENQIFIANNPSSQFNVGTDEVIILRYKDRQGEGFRIRVRTRAPDEYKEIDQNDMFCQLLITPYGEKNTYAAVNGKCLGLIANDAGDVNIVWEFDLRTDWDVTSNHSIVFKDMFMFINEPRKFEIPLKTTLHFVYGLLDQHIPGYTPNEVDAIINREILRTDNITAISHDSISCEFGTYLNNFWSNGIAVQGTRKYRRYKEDVPRIYTKDVYEIDTDGLLNVVDGDLVLVHRKGDPVLDEHGNPVLKARAGDVVVDVNGEPLLDEDGERKVIRLLDILMIDGIYYFATDANDMKYKALVGSTLKNYIVYDLGDIGQRLLENTQLYFYPKRTMGDAKLIVDGGAEIQIPMRLSFKVTYYLDEATYANYDIRNAIIDMTHRRINKHLERQEVSRSDIIADLREQAGEGVLAVDVDKLGPRKDITVYTTKDAAIRCSVKRLLKIQPDKTLKVIEDIEVNFVKHNIIEELRG